MSIEIKTTVTASLSYETIKEIIAAHIEKETGRKVKCITFTYRYKTETNDIWRTASYVGGFDAQVTLE